MITLNLGKGIVRTVDPSKLNAAVKDHCVYLGLKNCIQDVHAQFTKKDHPDTFKKLSEAAVDRKIAALYNGELRTSTPTVSIDDAKKMVAESYTTEELEAMLAKRKKAAKAA